MVMCLTGFCKSPKVGVFGLDLWLNLGFLPTLMVACRLCVALGLSLFTNLVNCTVIAVVYDCIVNVQIAV